MSFAGLFSSMMRVCVPLSAKSLKDFWAVLCFHPLTLSALEAYSMSYVLYRRGPGWYQHSRAMLSFGGFYGRSV